MPFSGAAIAYAVVGGLIAYSGIKGATLTDTAKSVLSGNLNLSDTQTVQFGTASPDSGSGSTPPGDTGASNNSAAANQAIAKKIIQGNSAYAGWDTGTEWADLVSLWNQESGWDSNRQNPTSTAYGIAQFLDTTWSGYGTKTSDPTKQITYGLEYIKNRYGSPSMAWGHERQYNWY